MTARKGADFSFVHSSWQQGIEAWRFHLPSDDQSPNFAAHTVLDRPLFRAGETVHMKHFIRAKTLAGFSIPGADDLPNSLSIRHLGSDEHYDFDLSWHPDGTADLDWEIPKSAKLGEYQIVMTRTKATATSAADDSGDSGTSDAIHQRKFSGRGVSRPADARRHPHAHRAASRGDQRSYRCQRGISLGRRRQGPSGYDSQSAQPRRVSAVSRTSRISPSLTAP